MSRSRRNLYRTSVTAAITLAIVLAALALGQFGGTTSSDARILPPPASFLPIVPPPSAVEKILNGPAVNLSNASSSTPVPAPTRLLIPAISVDTSVVALGKNHDGSAQVPSGTTYSSWYDLGPKPGQTWSGCDPRTRRFLHGSGRVLPVKEPVAGRRHHRAVWSKGIHVRGLETIDLSKGALRHRSGVRPDTRRRTSSDYVWRTFDTSVGHYEDNIVVYAVLVG